MERNSYTKAVRTVGLGGMLVGFGGGVMLIGLTVSLFVQWLHLPLEFGRGSTSVSLVSALIGTITAQVAHANAQSHTTRHQH
jgi:hypothetical protein